MRINYVAFFDPFRYSGGEMITRGLIETGRRHDHTIHGVQDAVVEGETALLHAPGAVKELADRLDQLVKDEPLRRRLGDAGHARARLLRPGASRGAVRRVFRAQAVRRAAVAAHRPVDADLQWLPTRS